MNLNDQDNGSLGALFGIPGAPSLTAIPVQEASFSVTHIMRHVPVGTVADVRFAPNDVYLLMLYMDDTRHCDLLPNGDRGSIRRYRQGAVCLVDLAQGASIELYESLHVLAFVLPRLLFDEVAQMTGGRAGRLRCSRGTIDTVLLNIGAALLPLFNPSQAHPPELLRHVATAICAHLLHDYGIEDVEDWHVPRLSISQERLVKGLLAESIDDIRSVEVVAEVLGMGRDDFERAFHATTGIPVGEWISQQGSLVEPPKAGTTADAAAWHRRTLH